MTLTEPIRDTAQARKLLLYFREKTQMRNYALAAIALHTALRISDILNINTQDVFNFETRSVRKSITIVEKKTGKKKIAALNKEIIDALTAYLPQAEPNQPLILNMRTNKAISRVQAYRIIREAAKAVGIQQKVGCHSCRKTFGYHSWKSGASPVVLMEIYNHSSYSITKRYLGISQDDQNEVYEKLRF
jgi:integrase